MGDTDPLADWLIETIPEHVHADDGIAFAATPLAADLRAALADGSLPLRAVLPPEVADVLDAAVAWLHAPAIEAWDREDRLAAAVDALPEHLRGGS